MRLETGVIFDNKPEDVVVYPNSVYVVKLCEEIQVMNEPEGAIQTKYQCDVEIYEIAEYIDVIQKENTLLNNQVTEAQIALVEVYELILD